MIAKSKGETISRTISPKTVQESMVHWSANGLLAYIKLNKNYVFRNSSDFYRISIIFQEESNQNHLPVISGSFVVFWKIDTGEYSKQHTVFCFGFIYWKIYYK